MNSFESLLSSERARRLKTLSNVRAIYIGAHTSLKEASGQSLIVLCYAHWEGFFNYCVDQYIDLVNSLGRKIVDVNPALLACEIEPHLSSMRDSNFPVRKRPDFARQMVEVMMRDRISQSTAILKAASNLDFDRLRTCLSSLSIPEDKFLEHRNFIAHELVKWRHQVAHGDYPVLEKADLIRHSHRTEDLLLIVKECFEDKAASLFP